MNITIVGGGNIGTQFAVHCAVKNHLVIIYTSKPELFDGTLYIVDEQEKILCEGNNIIATSDPVLAFQNAELILVTLPSNMMTNIAETIFCHTEQNVIIGVVPGNGGSECSFKKCIERGNTFFGIQRVPAIARLIYKGKSVKSVGYRNELHVASLPRENAEKCAKIISDIFDKPCKAIPYYLNLTLTPSNPILHTVRLRKIFNEWKEGITYSHLPLFYEDWDNESSEMLIACDEEVQNICSALVDFDLTYVKSLREHYESYSIEALTNKISSIPSLKGLKTPSIKTEKGIIPDLHSRYFTADFSYGLAIIQQIAVFARVNTPNIDETMSWYNEIAIEKEKFQFNDYGIANRDEFIKFYLL